MRESRMRSWKDGSRRLRRFATLAASLSLGAALGGTLTLTVVRAAERETDFSAILGEMRNAVSHTSDLRTRADRTGDRVKETCAYERLRGMMSAVEAAEVAQVSWEGDKARGDDAAATQELQRAQQALELVRKMRNEADNCI